jgi:acyl carrier protein
MNREQRRHHLIEFLGSIQRPDFALKEITEEMRLLESGIFDSLALLQIITYLEQTYGIDLSDKGIDPWDLRSVDGILQFIARETAT